MTGLPSFEALATLVVIGAVFFLTPGPAVLYIVARSLGGGFEAGMRAAIGLSLGALVHVALTIVGVAALIASSPAALSVLQVAGAAWLVVLGARTLWGLARAPEGAADSEARPPAEVGAAIYESFVVNLLNPKAVIFHLAFVPQFVDPGRGAVALQLAVLGVALVVTGFCSDALWAWTAGGVLKRLLWRRTRVLSMAGGVLLIALGVAAARARLEPGALARGPDAAALPGEAAE